MPYKILVIATHMRVSGVGASRIDELCHDLDRFGHRIIVFTEAKIPFEKPGVFRPSPNLLLYKFPIIKVPRILYNPLNVILITILGWYILRKKPPRIILAAIPEGEPAVTGYLLSRVFKVPIIIDIRDIWLENAYMKPKQIYRPVIPFRIGLIFKRFFSAIYHRCSHIIVVTETMKDYYIKEYKIFPKKISIIHNGARVSLAKVNISKDEVRNELKLPSKKFILSYVGVLVSYYQFSLMFEAIYKLREKFSNFIVLIVGDGSQKNLCQNMVKKLHLENIVIFSGWVAYDMACKFIRASDLGIVPIADRLDMEIAIPQKVFDYMASGVPTIVTGKSSWEIYNFFKKTEAGLVCPHSSDEITNCIYHLINNKDVLNKFSVNGRKAIIKQYNRERASFEVNKTIDLVLLKQ